MVLEVEVEVEVKGTFRVEHRMKSFERKPPKKIEPNGMVGYYPYVDGQVFHEDCWSLCRSTILVA